MKYCTYCGSKNRSNGIYCENCGHPLAYEPIYQEQTQVPVEEKNTFWWGVLGFFVPVAGLIIFLIWLKEKPKSSKSAGIGALIRVIVTIFMTIVFVFFALITVVDEAEDYENRHNEYRYEERYDEDWT